MAAVFRPVIWLLSGSTEAILHLLRVDSRAETGKVSRDEIMMLVDLGAEQGVIRASEKELIGNILRPCDAAVQEEKRPG